MAKRPVFVPVGEGQRYVRENMIDFVWSPGLAVSQKLKNIRALHEAAAAQGLSPLLEISTKSETSLGVQLSAFNVLVELENGSIIPLECAFQGSKVFEHGGPYHDIYFMSSREAKRDERLHTSGRIVSFQFEAFAIPAEPKTAFYDWLYTRALASRRDFLESLEEFAGFTDIEFNPAKSINCQARSCALFVSLHKQRLIDEAISTPKRFIEMVAVDSFAQPYSEDLRHGKLF
ncbi:MAG: DarT1-associated NADAR antitoxin family protein [Thermoleophilia bacterium]